MVLPSAVEEFTYLFQRLIILERIDRFSSNAPTSTSSNVPPFMKSTHVKTKHVFEVIANGLFIVIICMIQPWGQALIKSLNDFPKQG